MKPEELSIGDWVNVPNYYWDESPYVGQIDGIVKRHGTYYLQFSDAFSAEIDKCEPIPITPEILEKNGFKSIYQNEKSAYKWKEYDDDDNYQSIIIDFKVKAASGMWNEKSRMLYKGRILYVHELQRAIKLCGISKNIEL